MTSEKFLPVPFTLFAQRKGAVGYLQVGDGKKCLVKPGETTVGRSPDCGLFINHQSVSLHHATIECDGPPEAVFIYDKDTLHGTRLWQCKMKPHVRYHLHNKSKVRIGEIDITYNSLAGTHSYEPPCAILASSVAPSSSSPPIANCTLARVQNLNDSFFEQATQLPLPLKTGNLQVTNAVSPSLFDAMTQVPNADEIDENTVPSCVDASFFEQATQLPVIRSATGLQSSSSNATNLAVSDSVTTPRPTEVATQLPSSASSIFLALTQMPNQDSTPLRHRSLTETPQRSALASPCEAATQMPAAVSPSVFINPTQLPQRTVATPLSTLTKTIQNRTALASTSFCEAATQLPSTAPSSYLNQLPQETLNLFSTPSRPAVGSCRASVSLRATPATPMSSPSLADHNYSFVQQTTPTVSRVSPERTQTLDSTPERDGSHHGAPGTSASLQTSAVSPNVICNSKAKNVCNSIFAPPDRSEVSDLDTSLQSGLLDDGEDDLFQSLPSPTLADRSSPVGDPEHIERSPVSSPTLLGPDESMCSDEDVIVSSQEAPFRTQRNSRSASHLNEFSDVLVAESQSHSMIRGNDAILESSDSDNTECYDVDHTLNGSEMLVGETIDDGDKTDSDVEGECVAPLRPLTQRLQFSQFESATTTIDDCSRDSEDLLLPEENEEVLNGASSKTGLRNHDLSTQEQYDLATQVDDTERETATAGINGLVNNSPLPSVQGSYDNWSIRGGRQTYLDTQVLTQSQPFDYQRQDTPPLDAWMTNGAADEENERTPAGITTDVNTTNSAFQEDRRPSEVEPGGTKESRHERASEAVESTQVLTQSPPRNFRGRATSPSDTWMVRGAAEGEINSVSEVNVRQKPRKEKTAISDTQVFTQSPPRNFIAHSPSPADDWMRSGAAAFSQFQRPTTSTNLSQSYSAAAVFPTAPSTGDVDADLPLSQLTQPTQGFDRLSLEMPETQDFHEQILTEAIEAVWPEKESDSSEEEEEEDNENDANKNKKMENAKISVPVLKLKKLRLIENTVNNRSRPTRVKKPTWKVLESSNNERQKTNEAGKIKSGGKPKINGEEEEVSDADSVPSRSTRTESIKRSSSHQSKTAQGHSGDETESDIEEVGNSPSRFTATSVGIKRSSTTSRELPKRRKSSLSSMSNSSDDVVKESIPKRIKELEKRPESCTEELDKIVGIRKRNMSRVICSGPETSSDVSIASAESTDQVDNSVRSSNSSAAYVLSKATGRFKRNMSRVICSEPESQTISEVSIASAKPTHVNSSNSNSSRSHLKNPTGFLKRNKSRVIRSDSETSDVSEQEEPTGGNENCDDNPNKENRLVGTADFLTNTEEFRFTGVATRTRASVGIHIPLRRGKTNQMNVAFAGGVRQAHRHAVLELGGQITEVQEADVLVADNVRKSVKLLSAIALGIPIVSSKWLTNSKKAGCWLEAFSHVLRDSTAEQKWNFSLEQSIRKAQNSNFMSGYFVATSPNVKPPPCEIFRICELSGATCLRDTPSTLPSNCLYISCSTDRATWPKNMKILDVEVILTGVLQQRLDLESYILRR